MSNNTPAKRTGNAVHRHLKTLALQWMKRNQPGQVDKLRKQARKRVMNGAAQ